MAPTDNYHVIDKKTIGKKAIGKKNGTYEGLAIVLDGVRTAGLGIATAYETSYLQYLLGFGTFCSAIGFVTNTPGMMSPAVQAVQPILGTLAALLSIGYHSMGDDRFATVLAGLAGACCANTLSAIFRERHKEGLERLMEDKS